MRVTSNSNLGTKAISEAHTHTPVRHCILMPADHIQLDYVCDADDEDGFASLRSRSLIVWIRRKPML